MTDFTLDTMRRAGMKLIGGLMILVALATLTASLVLDAPNEMLGVLAAIALPAYPVMLALRGHADAGSRMIVTMTLVAQPAVLLVLFEGRAWQVDLHMIFFASLAASAVLCDWRALIAGAGVVAVHHLLLGMLVPDWVFLSGGGIGRILLHAVVLIAETVALVLMAQRVAGLLDALKVEAEQRGAAEAATSAERERHATELRSVIETVTQSLESLAAGDLSQRMRRHLPPAYSALETNFGRAIDSLRGLIGSVSRGAEAIRLGSNEIANASADLARRTERAASSLETTNNAIATMDSRLKTIANEAEGVVARADQAINTVRQSRAVADEVVGAMNRVADSAKGIDGVIEGLDKIAFQTRVLAMNAAVEAGRAGEAGRGFAVVADLVSALAMRAEEEAGRARDQLTATQADILTAVDAVQKVNGSLAGISTDVSSVHELLGKMANDNQSQAAAIGQIARAVADMDAATQHNAAMVEETSATATNLAHEVEALADNAGRFQLDERDKRPAAAFGASVH